MSPSIPLGCTSEKDAISRDVSLRARQAYMRACRFSCPDLPRPTTAGLFILVDGAAIFPCL